MQQAVEGPQASRARKFMHACEMSVRLSHTWAPYHKAKRLTHSTLPAYVAGSLAFHQWYPVSSIAHLALTTALGIAASYSPASLFTEFLSGTTPKPARKPFCYGGKTQQFSLVTSGKSSRMLYRGWQVSINLDNPVQTGGLQSPVQSNEDDKNTARI